MTSTSTRHTGHTSVYHFISCSYCSICEVAAKRYLHLSRGDYPLCEMKPCMGGKVETGHSMAKGKKNDLVEPALRLALIVDL
jgi:hypothetical protein